MRKIATVTVAVLTALAVLGFIYREEAARLFATLSLFDEDRIVENFSAMDTLFESRPVPVGEASAPLPGEPVALPRSVEAAGRTVDVRDFLEASRTTSLVVLRDGEVVHEFYGEGTRPDDRRISWSMAKSVLSLGVGVAVERGLLDLDRTVDSYVPTLADSAYRGVTVRQALRMSSGVRFDEDYLAFFSDINRMGRTLALGGSMDEFAASVDERERAAGTARQYVSIDTHVVAMVLRAATGRTLPQWIGETILQPLGIGGAPYYVTDGEGVAFALGGLNMTTRDYARIGQMVLDKGKANGARIVPEEWIEESTVVSAEPPEEADGFGYGYQWWIPDDTEGVALARGVYGQYIWIDRPRGVVIVKTSGDRAFREAERVADTLALLEGLANAVAQ